MKVSILLALCVLPSLAVEQSKISPWDQRPPEAANPLQPYIGSVELTKEVYAETLKKGVSTDGDLNRLRIFYLGVLKEEAKLAKLPANNLGELASVPRFAEIRKKWQDRSPTSAAVEKLTLGELETRISNAWLPTKAQFDELTPKVPYVVRNRSGGYELPESEKDPIKN